VLSNICSYPALDAKTIQRIDGLVSRHFDAAIKAWPDNGLRQDRHLRDLVLEDVPPNEQALAAMQVDHYLLCLRLNTAT
jgi:hypothetical protein